MTAPITSRSTVCALVPHFRCEEWLEQAVESLLDQTRPVDAIVVVDDGSDHPPVDIVRRHPEVTLLAAPDNAGPYRLVQAAIDATDFDAYLFQDADDWSAPDRLAVLLAEAEATEAELIGSHEVRVLVEEGDVVPVRYPLDVNAALAERPAAFPLLHPTSLVARDLLARIGGFATGMRFSGDAELLRRAAHVAVVRNADDFCYFRRKRRGSLTLGSDTELGSPARQAVQDELAARAHRNADAVRAGRAPDLAPWRRAATPELRHLAGPVLGARRSTRDRRPLRAHAPTGGPVFVLGAPRAGHTVLAWALGQHPSFTLLPDSRWLARLASDVEARAGEEAVAAPSGLRAAMASTLSSVAAPSDRRLLAAGHDLVPAVHALHQLFEGARFIHVVRPPDDTAHALATAPTTDGSFYTEEAAWRSWVVATEAMLDAEAALGTDTVLRVRWTDLVADPAAVLDRCLGFLAERDAPSCLRPLRGLARPPVVQLEPPVAPALVARARQVGRRALEASIPHAGSDRARRRLTERFHRERASFQPNGGSLVERVHGLVTAAVPEGANVAVVSRGDPRLVDLPGRTAWHLPEVDGVYAGYHPADGADALAHLGRLRDRGAEFLVVPASSLWWLTYYAELTDELTRDATLVAYDEEVGAVYRLGRSPVARVTEGPPAPRFGVLHDVAADLQEARAR